MISNGERAKLHQKFKIGLFVFFGIVIIGLGFLIYKKLQRYVPTLYTPMFYDAQPPLNYTLIPNWNGFDHSVAVSSNELGVRDNPWSNRKKEDLRVLFVGDSQTFGVSVEFEKTFPQLTQQRLLASGISAGSYGAGVPGWNFADQLEFTKYHWSKANPHFVVILLIDNDLDSAIDAGPTYQLMAPKKPFAPFYRVFDPWSLEAFTMAYKDNKNLELNFKNAFKEAGRLAPYPSLFFLGIGSSGQQLYVDYKRNLTEFKNLVDANQAEILILADSRRPGGFAEKKFAGIFEELDIKYEFLSHWTGNTENYMKNWSNLPLDNHGGENFHKLLSELAITHLKEKLKKRFPKLQKVDPQVPERLDTQTYNAIKSKVAQSEKKLVDSIGPSINWDNPPSIKQVVTIGGELSQTRIVFKAAEDSRFLSLRPRHDFTENCAVWVEMKDYQGFLGCHHVAGQSWIELPYVITKGQIFEIGFVYGKVKNGFFSEVFPVTSFNLMAQSPQGLAFVRPGYILTPGAGVFSDGWASKSSNFKVFGTADSTDRYRLKLSGHSYAPESKYPINVQAVVKQKTVAEFEIKKWGEFAWTFDIPRSFSSNSTINEIVFKSDNSFVPAKLDEKNLDQRELSYFIKSIEISKK